MRRVRTAILRFLAVFALLSSLAVPALSFAGHFSVVDEAASRSGACHEPTGKNGSETSGAGICDACGTCGQCIHGAAIAVPQAEYAIGRLDLLFVAPPPPAIRGLRPVPATPPPLL